VEPDGIVRGDLSQLGFKCLPARVERQHVVEHQRGRNSVFDALD
jgi:hypothetical protein